MEITQADPAFRPVTIVLETPDDYDKLFAIVEAVAQNRTNHTNEVRVAAQRLMRELSGCGD